MEIKGLNNELVLYNIVRFLKERDLISKAEERKLYMLLDSKRSYDKV